MTKPDATNEARLGALMCGGTWLVTCLANDYQGTDAERYESTRCGSIVDVFAPFTLPRWDEQKVYEA